MPRLTGVTALRRQQQDLRRQADELERDIEAIYEKVNVCPDCEGRGYQTVMVPKRIILGWPDSLYQRICARCRGNGHYAKELTATGGFTIISSGNDSTASDGRLYWG